MLRTDGYGVHFILTGPKKQTEDLPDLDLSDLTANKMDTAFYLWSTDPGMTNIFIASDGYSHDVHQTRGL
ncbi:unnamed protein product [Rhizopus stolonifer]